MMELEKPLRKRASSADRFGGPASIIAFSGVVAALSQGGVFAATGYSRGGERAKLVSTRETAELLWFLAVFQLLALGLAWLFLVLTNMLDPGAVELNTLSSMVDMASEGADQRSRTGRLLKLLPDGSEIEFRWCWHCKIWRPPMANHCPTCNRCFLKLDHHCPWTGNCIAAHNIRLFWAMIACFGIAGILIPVGLIAFFTSAIINHDDVHTAVYVIGGVFAAYLVCAFGGMFFGATVMFTRTLKTIFNPRGGKANTDVNHADWFAHSLAHENAAGQSCSVLAVPCRCRQH
ncbi:DHHC palmitoyltransferase-domain-containing protein [Pavlovales sp. CCMP2436]|nr:DHHC palmitoyltransferase-domain-containing protein [Pavlovales sp. CCMP2436]|mmetsp:Transcript_5988/g.15702  ORF Transcript_5988/g.15702 Transcript_5988/m.15702 type:complete len:290 (+) Transcript_5988:75-944(+)